MRTLALRRTVLNVVAALPALSWRPSTHHVGPQNCDVPLAGFTGFRQSMLSNRHTGIGTDSIVLPLMCMGSAFCTEYYIDGQHFRAVVEERPSLMDRSRALRESESAWEKHRGVDKVLRRSNDAPDNLHRREVTRAGRATSAKPRGEIATDDIARVFQTDDRTTSEYSQRFMGVLEEAVKEHFSSDGTPYISTRRAYCLLNSVLDAWIKAGSFGTNDPDIKRTNDGKPMGFKVAYLKGLRAVCTENKRHA